MYYHYNFLFFLPNYLVQVRGLNFKILIACKEISCWKLVWISFISLRFRKFFIHRFRYQNYKSKLRETVHSRQNKAYTHFYCQGNFIVISKYDTQTKILGGWNYVTFMLQRGELDSLWALCYDTCACPFHCVMKKCTQNLKKKSKMRRNTRITHFFIHNYDFLSTNRWLKNTHKIKSPELHNSHLTNFNVDQTMYRCQMEF